MKLIHSYRYAHFTNGIPYHKYFLNQAGGLKPEFKFHFRTILKMIQTTCLHSEDHAVN